MVDKYVLVMESSTSSAKVLLLNINTGEREIFAEKFSKQSSNNGIQDAEGVFKETTNLARKVAEGKDISIIVLSGIWHSLLICDQNMIPISKTYTWASTMENQVAKYDWQHGLNDSSYYLKTGCMNSSIYPFFKLLHLKNIDYNFSDKIFCGQGSFTNYKLTGNLTVSDSMASGSGLLDIEKRRYAKDLLEKLDLAEDQLPKVVHYKETSLMSQEGADYLGVKPGIPVVTACPDGGLNQVATSSDTGVMSFSVGTSAAIRLNTDKAMFIPGSGIWSYLSPEKNIIGAATSGACNCTDWYKDNFLKMPYSEINKKTAEIVDTPIFFPFLFGERSPGWDSNRLGQFTNVKPEHTPFHFFKAIEEGVLFNIYQCYKEIEETYDGNIDSIYLSGGILNSENWTQMCANIFNKSLFISKEKEASLWGGAILGIKKLGLENQIDLKQNSFDSIIEPQGKEVEFYQEKFKEYIESYETYR
jgi:gluconokinase